MFILQLVSNCDWMKGKQKLLRMCSRMCMPAGLHVGMHEERAGFSLLGVMIRPMSCNSKRMPSVLHRKA